MKCPSCGKEIAEDSLFCEYCGTKLESVASVPPEQKIHSKSRTPLWMILALLPFVIIGGVVIYYQHCAQQAAIEEANQRAEKERIAREETERKASLAAQGFVDLGLPSGTLWKDKNEAGGFYSYDKAMAMFGNSLPNKEQWEELKSSCSWVWSGRGYTVTGPSGESIALPAAGFCYLGHGGGVTDVGSEGYYWSSTPYDSKFAWRIFFYSSSVTMYYFEHSGGMSVRLVYK